MRPAKNIPFPSLQGLPGGLRMGEEDRGMGMQSLSLSPSLIFSLTFCFSLSPSLLLFLLLTFFSFQQMTVENNNNRQSKEH